MTGLRRAPYLLALLLFVPPVLAAPPWAHEHSDLAPDPAVTWGVLPNGLRYAIRPNAEPQGRVSLRFLVQVGSMEEQDDERGLAHFVEHMAFRSTRNHPNGSLVADLQRLGIGFGPDNTAFTTYDYTIYHLELPDAKPETLREALGVFREYADGLLFQPDEIERERGVVLSEMATRDTPEYRVTEARMKFFLPQARQTIRAPIGLEDQIRHFTPAQFHAFYDAWYRPERMIVAIVGTVDPAAVAPLVAEILGPVADRAPARPMPPAVIPGVDEATAPVRVFTDPSVFGFSISLERAGRLPDEADTRAKRTRGLHHAIAFHMFQQRLNKLALRRDTSFVAASTASIESVHGWRENIVGFPGKFLVWRLLVSDAEQELRKAREFGFTAGELAEARKAYTTYYRQGARSAATVPSDALATQLATSIAYDEIFSSAALIEQEMQPLVDATTVEECNEAFRAAWGDAPPRMFVSANSGFTPGESEVAAAFAYSQRVEVLPPAARGLPTFAYTDFGPPGTLTHRDHVASLDADLTQFANGTRLNFKRTDFEADTVLVSLRVGAGRVTQPANAPGLDLLANYGFLSGGLGRHTNAEMSDILNGHVISLGFSVESDTLAFSLRCAPRELLLGLQTLTAVLTDAAYRPEAIRIARANFGSLLESLSASPGGPIFATATRVMTSGDLRFGVPTIDVLMARNLTELRHWLEPQLRQGPVEVSIVGDVDFDTAEQAVARTLGALPDRPIAAPATARLKIAAPPAQPMIWPVNPKLGQGAVAFLWPVKDLKGVHMERRCRLLAGLIEERLRQRLREELGATYALSTTFVTYDGFPDLSYFETYAEVDPDRSAEVDRLIRREVAAMQREGITPDEFDRAKQPFIAQRTADLRSNAYWGYTVLRDAQSKPERLTAAEDRTADTAAITPAELQSLIDRYLAPDAAFTFRTNPRAWAPPVR